MLDMRKFSVMRWGQRKQLNICVAVVVQSFFADEEKWSPHGMTLIKVSGLSWAHLQAKLKPRTKTQSSMVSNRALAIICVESGLHRFLLHDKPNLTQSIKSFVEELEACKRDAQNDSQRLKYWSSLQAPKVRDSKQIYLFQLAYLHTTGLG